MGRTCGKAEQGSFLGTVKFEQGRPITAHSVAGFFLLAKHPDRQVRVFFSGTPGGISFGSLRTSSL